MASLLNIGASAANVFKSALDVTSSNVANVGTDGYSRQRVEISTNSTSGMILHGGAPSIDSVERMKSSFLQTQILSNEASYQRYNEQYDVSSQIEGVALASSEGTEIFMNRFFDSLTKLSGEPTLDSLHKSVADEANSFEGQISNLGQTLMETQEQINNKISSLANSINQDLDRIAEINQHTVSLSDASTKEKNSLLDQRDLALRSLSEKLDIKVNYQGDGSAMVYMAKGAIPLISGNSINHLKAESSEFIGDKKTHIYVDMSGTEKNITGSIKGGQLGGLIDVRDKVLNSAISNTGLMLNAFTASTNWRNYQGWDLEGNPGEAIFKELSATAYKSINNDSSSGDGSEIKVAFNPAPTSQPPYNNQPSTFGAKEAAFENALKTIGDFKPREYELKYDENKNEFEVYSGKELLTNISAPGTANIDGLEFTIDGIANYSHGDTFLLAPHKEMLNSFESMLSEKTIATRGQTPVNSTGTNDYSNEIPSPSGIEEGLNALNLGNLSNQSFMNNDSEGKGTRTFSESMVNSLSEIGSYVNKSELRAESQKAVYQQIVLQDESVSGVNLDEEAANLIRYQQAYEASAQIISISQSIFQTLIQSMR